MFYSLPVPVTAVNSDRANSTVNKSDTHADKPARPARKPGVVTPLNNHRRRSLQSSKQQQSLPAPDPATLKRLRESIDQLPEINATRVVQLHQRIMAGEYQVDTDRVAEKLLNLESLLIKD